jgi:hypothetical protein
MEAAFAGMIAGAPATMHAAVPASGGRSIRAMAEHVTESQAVYVRMALGPVTGLPDALHAVSEELDLSEALMACYSVANARLAVMNDEERRRAVPHGQVTWTARRTIRRLLEHQW